MVLCYVQQHTSPHQQPPEHSKPVWLVMQNERFVRQLVTTTEQMVEVHGCNPELIGFNPFVWYTVINPVTPKEHHISSMAIVQINYFPNNAIIYLFST